MDNGTIKIKNSNDLERCSTMIQPNNLLPGAIVIGAQVMIAICAKETAKNCSPTWNWLNTPVRAISFAYQAF